MPDNPVDPNSQPVPAAPQFGANEKLQKINVSDEIKNSFLDYSMSVIIARALPDVRDGLKPSQRRILYAMQRLNLYPGRKHYKCAKICGDTSGDFHPHGETVIYPTLVHMAQPWAMREPLVDGQGNFGSVEGDPPAAMRYTEARMTHMGAALMDDMEKDTVDFVPNYDERLMEPVVFPATFPNLLVNGGTGIAVGMATNMAPHNLGEVVDGICAQLDKPDITIPELMKYIKGPDFPTGCMVCGLEPIRDYFMTGRGSVKIRGRMTTEDTKTGREQIIVTEIPYNVNRATLVERIAELVNEKIIPDISAIRDESDEKTRVVIELKRDAIAKVIINNLYQHTALESSFAVNALAIDHGRPKTLNLKELISCYIEHRREVVLRRTRFELRKAEERAETLEGFLIALANLDDFIRIIRQSKSREEAKVKILAYEFVRAKVEAFGITIRNEGRIENGLYKFSEEQANAILDLRLYQLTGMEVDKLKLEYKDLLTRIADLQDILAREARVFAIIKAELLLIKQKFATPRLTELVPDEGEIAIEDLIANEGVIITLTHAGLIKRTNVSEYRAQHRGGKGVIGMATREATTANGKDEDFIEHLFTASTHDYLMFFTNTGRVYVERVHEIPDMARAAKGRSIANLLELQAGEKIAAFIRVESKYDDNKEDKTWTQPGEVFFATLKGTVKKTELSDFANVRKDGIIAINIEEGDTLIEAKLTRGAKVDEQGNVSDPGDDIILITREGMSARFSESKVRSMGRSATGVRGITLKPATFYAGDIKSLAVLAGKLIDHSDPVSSFIWDNLQKKDREDLAKAQKEKDTAELRCQVVDALNYIVEREIVYDENRFANIKLRKVTEDLVALFKLSQKSEAPNSFERDDLLALNCYLIEDAYAEVVREFQMDQVVALAVVTPEVLPDVPGFVGPDIVNIEGIARKLKDKADAVSTFIWEQLDETLRKNIADTLEKSQNLASDLEQYREALVTKLNALVAGSPIYDEQRFKDVSLNPRTEQYLEKKPQQGKELAYLNQLLLENAFDEISKNRPSLLVSSENGLGKRTDFCEYPVRSRGGKGIITMKTTARTGGVIGALTVTDKDEIMLISVSGQMVRTRVSDVREAGRNTQGVKLMDLEGDDKLQAMAPVITEEGDEEEGEQEAGQDTPPAPDANPEQPKS